jgi:hypothetical protein
MTAQSPDGSTVDGVGTRVVHRRYVSYSHAHYAGNLVEGAFVLGLFGDVATELSIRIDGDEGLFASYSDVQFVASLRGGDVVEVSATLVRRGRRSREHPGTWDQRRRCPARTPPDHHRARHGRRTRLSRPRRVGAPSGPRRLAGRG